MRITLLLLALLAQSPAETPLGHWKTIDDKSHKPRGTVRLYEQDGAVFGAIEGVFDPAEAARSCTKCGGERKDKPIIGLVILRNMKKNGAEYSGGDILDPETGSVYRCRMWLEDGGKKLVLRGFIGISLLGRSQTWLRQE